ncbi:MAG: sigma 54-interacting transcriptional regulator [Deltaproteobacteria bacterium]|nr:sigma 54-interacting transcriptional regulator [Deltaproteobacteria bacterium]
MSQKTHELWNNRFLSQIIDSMGDGVFTLDSGGRISSWNPSMERITGYTAAEALGKTCGILQCSRCFGKQCPASLKECGIFRHGKGENKECLVRHKEGHDVPVIKNAGAVRDEDDAIIGVVETLTDLTELKKARRKAEEATRRLAEKHRFGNIIGKSHGMQQVFTAIKAAAASHATILIQGESGTGKELVAGAIHFNSSRKEKPFVTVNCSALSESLLESELFGHVRGAFTGAVRDRMGRFEEAGGGTLFLDEIGEISPYIQVKLLRVLQEREIERVGESRRRKIDIRIVAATHQDLYSHVREGGFREDLYYRLKVFPITIPPLRKHKDDLPLLLNHFIGLQNRKTGKSVEEMSQSAMRIIMDYPWPGNVRELENAVEHAFVLCDTDQIDLFDLPVEIRQMTYQPLQKDEVFPSTTGPRSRKKLTKSLLIEILDDCDWNKAEVGRRVGLSRTAIWKYMKKWDIPLKKIDA